MEFQTALLSKRPARALAALIPLFGLLPVSSRGAPEISIEQPAGSPLVAAGVAAFGDNTDGQCSIPAGLTGVIDVSAGGNRSAALKIDGTVVEWGDFTGFLPPGLSGVEFLSTGAIHSTALKSDGSVVGWASIFGTPAGAPFKAVAAGLGWTVAVKSDGVPIVWGQNIPVVPPGLNGLVAVAAGDFHAVGLKADGTVVAWGNNSHGQSIVPAGLSGVVQVRAGHRYSLALKGDGTVVSWGFNDNGGGLPSGVPAGLSGVVALDADGHTLALKNNDTITGWGRGAEGQLSPPAGLSKIRAIAAGDYHSLALYGSVISFGAQNTGTATAARTFVIKNTGPDPLTVSSVSLAGANAGDFTLSTAGMLTSLPGTNGQTTFSVTFSPGTAGNKKTMLRVANSDSDEALFEVLLTGTGTVPEVAVSGNGTVIANGDTLPSAADHTDFGGIPHPGTGSITRTFTVSNSGSGVLTTGAVSISGVNAADFTVVAQPASSVAAGGSTTFQIKFDPSGAGIRLATVSLPTNDADENPCTFAILGNGLEPEVAVSEAGANVANGSTPAPYFADVHVVNSIHGRTFMVTNTGTAPLAVGLPVISGANAGDFYLNTTPSSTLAPGASTTFQVVFDPTAPGVRTALVSFTNNDLDENPFSFTVRGTGLMEEMAVTGNGQPIVDGSTATVSQNHTHFGVLALPRTATRTYTVANLGNSSLALGQVSLGGPAATDFSVISQPAGSIAPGATTSFSIQFAPGALGERKVTVSIPSSDADENPYNFDLAGTGGQTGIMIESPPGNPLPCGTVMAWGGNNTLGELNVPPGLKGVVALGGNFGHTVALKGDGTVAAWGQNDKGQAVVPAGLRNVVKVSASRWHSLALRSDGTLAAWGFNDRGQCNTAGITGVSAIAAGDEYTVIVRNGSPYAWGSNYMGEIAVDTSLTDVTAVSAGYLHTMVLRANGTVQVNGRNFERQSIVPTGLGGVTAIAAGFNYCLARKSDGTLALWGENEHDEYAAWSQTGIAAIAAGEHHCLALKENGDLVAWGDNTGGKATIPPGLTGARAIMAGRFHSAAVVDSTVSFGTVMTGQASPAKTFTIKNTGSIGLSLSSVSVTGSNAGDFQVNTAGMQSSLPGASETAVQVVFSPLSTGLRTARLRVISDDVLIPAFEIILTGTATPALSALEAWRLLHFGTSANSGDAADEADPDQDGWNNLFEYRAGLLPANAASTFQYRQEGVAGQPGLRRVIFSPLAAGSTYTVEWSGTGESGTWQPLVNASVLDNGGERTVTDLDAGASRKFYRVRVERP